MKKSLSFILILFLLSTSYISCRKEKGYPHVIPSANVMLIDFSNFIPASQQSVEKNFDVKGVNQYNWEEAVRIVSPWRELTSVTLSVPLAAYMDIANKKASQLSASKWEWSSNVTIIGEVYKVRLTGEVTGSQVKWEMYISGRFPEFRWLEGTSNTAGTTGRWTFNESNTEQTALLQIDWTRAGTNIEKIRYTYLKNVLSKDSYIEYGQASGSYSSYYTVHYYNTNLFKFSDANIEWNASDAGRIMSADYLDGNWRCWDSQKMDDICN